MTSTSEPDLSPLRAGLRILTKDVTMDDLAVVLKEVLGGQIYDLLQQIEERSDWVQPVCIDVDEVLENAKERSDWAHQVWAEPYASMDDDTRKLAVRAKMDDMKDMDYVAEQKYKILDTFLDHLKEEGWTVSAEAEKAEEADGPAEAGADGDSG